MFYMSENFKKYTLLESVRQKYCLFCCYCLKTFKEFLQQWSVFFVCDMITSAHNEKYRQDHQWCRFSKHFSYIRIEIGNANSSCYAFLYKYALHFVLILVESCCRQQLNWDTLSRVSKVVADHDDLLTHWRYI